jgi:hypothetical protein
MTLAILSIMEHRVVSADLSRNGIVIVFDDGNTALFPASILYESLAHIPDAIDGPGPEELVEEP